jgi:hypothetical protein
MTRSQTMLKPLKILKETFFFVFFLQIQKSRQKKLPDPIIFACLFILMGDVLEIFDY